MRLINWLFRHEEINGGGRCPTYMHRWRLLRLWGGRAVYIHKFIADDWARDLHDHPKGFVSIGLWGSYIEVTPARLDMTRYIEMIYSDIERPAEGLASEATQRQLYTAPWFRAFPPEHIHQLILPEGVPACWTLVLVGPARREWGFWHRGVWMHWAKYLRSIHADQERSC